MQQSLEEKQRVDSKCCLSPRKNGLTSLNKEVRAFKVFTTTGDASGRR